MIKKNGKDRIELASVEKTLTGARLFVSKTWNPPAI